jgi:hypothetical protein
LYHGELRIAPYPPVFLTRLFFNNKALGDATTGLKFRTHPSKACGQQRRRGRTGGPVRRIDDDEIGDRPPPAISSAHQLDKVRVPAEQSFAQKFTSAIRDLWRPAFSIGDVQAAKPHDSAVVELNIEALIDSDGFDTSNRPPASRKAGRSEGDGQEGSGSATVERSGGE